MFEFLKFELQSCKTFHTDSGILFCVIGIFSLILIYAGNQIPGVTNLVCRSSNFDGNQIPGVLRILCRSSNFDGNQILVVTNPLPRFEFYAGNQIPGVTNPYAGILISYPKSYNLVSITVLMTSTPVVFIWFVRSDWNLRVSWNFLQ